MKEPDEVPRPQQPVCIIRMRAEPGTGEKLLGLATAGGCFVSGAGDYMHRGITVVLLRKSLTGQ